MSHVNFSGTSNFGKKYGSIGAKVVRNPARGSYRNYICKALGEPIADTYVTEVSQDTWIYFPWDMDLTYAEPISGKKDD